MNKGKRTVKTAASTEHQMLSVRLPGHVFASLRALALRKAANGERFSVSQTAAQIIAREVKTS